MKKIFNLVVFLFILVISLVLSLISQIDTVQITSSDYIRELKTESVVLISTNTYRGELSNRQSENNLGLTSLFPFLLSLTSSTIFFEKQIIGFNTNCIYNLFNNLQKIHKIRAP